MTPGCKTRHPASLPIVRRRRNLAFDSMDTAGPDPGPQQWRGPGMPRLEEYT
jgi:hypothetical protein